MQPHRLSLMLNDNGDGTHGFRFLGEQEFKNEASFDGNELQDLIDQTRGALRLAAWGDDDPWKDQTYRYEGQLDQDRLRKDLIRFAIRGYRFYDAVINRLSGDAREAEKLAALMRESGLVQIASKESTRLVLPAAMIYDYAFDTNADSALYTLCPDFLAAVTNPTPLEEVPCFKSSCPHATREDNETLICPSGFWGYRHAIGMPLSVATAPDAPSVIAAPGGPQVAVGVSTDANFVMRADHERALQGLRAGLDWNYADTRQTTLELLKTTRSHVIYFYCHGGIANDVPYIQVGPVTERGITRDTLRYKKIRWNEPRPLVFINGCHTTALEPEEALEFVSALVENTGASGVIGTEITIFEPLATQFAKHCLDRFLDGAPVGAAVRSARLALLKDGNPLGLVYLPFAMADLRLVEAPPVA